MNFMLQQQAHPQAAGQPFLSQGGDARLILSQPHQLAVQNHFCNNFHQVQHQQTFQNQGFCAHDEGRLYPTSNFACSEPSLPQPALSPELAEGEDEDAL